MALSRARSLELALLATSLSTGCYHATRISVAERTETYWATSDRRPLQGKRLTLADALQRAKAENAEVAARKAQLEALRAEVEASAAIDNPELRVGQLRLDRLTHDDAEVEVKLRVKPPRPIENDARRAEAEAEARAAEAELAAAEVAAVARARVAYYEAASADRVIAAARRLDALAEKRSAIVLRGLSESRVTQLEVALANVDRAGLARDLRSLEREKARALSRLGDQIAADLPDDVELDAIDLEALTKLQLPEDAALVKLSMTASPDLARRAAEVDAASAKADRQRTGQVPWFSFLELGYDFSKSTVDPEGFTFGAGLSLPVFDTRSAAIDAADAQVEARKRRLDADARALLETLREAVREVKTEQEALGVGRDELRAATKQAAEEADKALAAGRIDELSRLRTDADQARLELEDAKALRRLLLSIAEVERLTGYRALQR